MHYNSNIHRRRSIRLKGYDYSQAGLYFVTIRVDNGKSLFGDIVDGKMHLNDKGKIVAQCWSEIPQHYPNTILHEFVVMPNHIHGIIRIINDKTVVVGVENFRPLPGIERLSVGAENFPPLRILSVRAVIAFLGLSARAVIAFLGWA